LRAVLSLVDSPPVNIFNNIIIINTNCSNCSNHPGQIQARTGFRTLLNFTIHPQTTPQAPVPSTKTETTITAILKKAVDTTKVSEGPNIRPKANE
jgi:hypothetical protein